MNKNIHIKGIKRQCFFRLLLCHKHYGYLSLKSLSTGNNIFITEENNLKCKIQDSYQYMT